MKQPKPLLQKAKKLKEFKSSANLSAEPFSESQTSSVSSSIAENFYAIKCSLGQGIGIVQATYDVFGGKAQIGVVYIHSLADTLLISRHIVEPLLGHGLVSYADSQRLPEYLQSTVITVPDVRQSNDMPQVVPALLRGNTILFIEGTAIALIVQSPKVEKRSIEKADNEVTISAALDSYIEDLDSNCNMLIRRLPTPDLQFEAFTVGRLSQTEVRLVWLKGVANEGPIAEARRRLQHIDIDALSGIGMLAELIRDSPLSVFPTYKQTQRPDLTARYLTDGRFAVLCNNSPFALTAPITFWENFKTMDDYAESTFVATYLRIARTLSFILAILISPFYLSFVTYDHSVTPPALAVNIATGRQGVPLPSAVELVILSLSITIIREASVRISGSVGFFIGTLSAVVIGQASVTAGYVSASVIIVAAITAITSFAVSTTTMVYTSRLINYFLILLASIFGMFGLINGLILVLWHALSLKSFGVPYLTPLVPFSLEGLKDTTVRAPFSALKKRLRILAPYNRNRQNNKKE